MSRPETLLAAMIGIAVIAAPAVAADPTACRELERKYELARRDISTIQVNMLLLSAADRGCEPLARALLDAGATVEARD